VGIFGHIGDGNIHFRPLLDINDPEDFQKMENLTREVNRTIIDYGGSLSGEHGDGRLRAEFLKPLYGEELYRLFTRVKELLDPAGILNPSVKLGETPFTANIDYKKYTLDCATCGKCNPVCPIYDMTRVESEGPRGWFRMLTSKECSWEDAKSPTQLCLNCKSCRTICPAGCDIPSLILERRSLHPEKVSGIALGLAFRAMRQPNLFIGLSKAWATTQSLWNTAGGRWLLEHLSSDLLKLRLDRRLLLPTVAGETLRERYPRLVEAEGRVAYFHGCADNLLANGVGDALIRVLNRNGVEVVLPEQRCCGTPLTTYGWVDDATRYARFNIDRLLRYAQVVTSCASCNLTLKEYPQLFHNDSEYREKAEQLATRVYDISEFLLREVDLTGMKADEANKIRVTYHDPCHLRATGITKAPREILQRIPRVEFVEMQDADRCCGGAGVFNLKHYDLSKEYFEMRKKPAILESGAEIVATSCPACIIQLNTGMQSTKTIRHVIQLLDDAYNSP
jgi:Fe-S oxidoreductase